MEDKLCFVQFMHPGGEHMPDTRGHRNATMPTGSGWMVGDVKSWNAGDHKRTFMVNQGRYLADDDVHGGQIVFWGEWEPEAEVRQTNPWVNHLPRHLFSPYYVPLQPKEWRQNTDPFVFGDRFLYSCCRQFIGEQESQLRYLSKGSVILFGSCMDKQEFVLDTVFVVADWIDYHPNSEASLSGHISHTFKEVTIDRIAAGSKTPRLPHRLYVGATYDAPYEEMYSYFPCLPYEADKPGFARPRIQLPGRITDNLLMGKKLNPQADIAVVKDLWDSVYAQVLDHQLMIGLATDLPARRDAPNSPNGTGQAPGSC